MRNAEDIIKDLNSYSPTNDEWNDLDSLIDEATNYSGEEVVHALLSILERNPDHDGFGVFWSIVHALEEIGGYEAELINSIRRQPHEMSILMLNRMLNAGINKIDSVPIINILQEVADNAALSNDIRVQAHGFIEYQENRI